VTPAVVTVPPKPSVWSEAVGALVRLRQSAMGKGDQELTSRAEKAIGELYGVQKFVETEGATVQEEVRNHTLIGIGGR
jgi:hypothetical protein